VREEITMDTVHSSFRRQGLVRPRDGRILGGVCAGLGARFGIDPWPARLLFVLILFVIPGSQILIYPILWILMPSQTPSVGAVLPTREPNSPLAPTM
jgi:phage shock protein PspC (stress-responsive transcriptional regulator)